MSVVRPSTRELFAAAREDGPSRGAHDRMWESVASATGIAAGTAAVAGGASSLKAAFTSKLVAVLGFVAVTGASVGVVASLSDDVSPIAASELGGRDAPASPLPRERGARTAAVGARLPPTPRPIDPAMSERAPRASVARSHEAEPSPAPVVVALTAKAPAASELAAEAKAITDARAALVMGDPKRALTVVRGARRLSTRALEPEALSLEARILQALGRSDEAAATELELRRRYPGHALAR